MSSTTSYFKNSMETCHCVFSTDRWWRSIRMGAKRCGGGASQGCYSWQQLSLLNVAGNIIGLCSTSEAVPQGMVALLALYPL